MGSGLCAHPCTHLAGADHAREGALRNRAERRISKRHEWVLGAASATVTTAFNPLAAVAVAAVSNVALRFSYGTNAAAERPGAYMPRWAAAAACSALG